MNIDINVPSLALAEAGDGCNQQQEQLVLLRQNRRSAAHNYNQTA